MLCLPITLLVFLNVQWTVDAINATGRGIKFQHEFMNHYRLKKKVKSKEVYDVMIQVDRKNYAPFEPYEEHGVSMGYNTHFSPPQVAAVALESLRTHVKEGSKVLDVGCGTGYLTVCLALMVGKTGYVVGIDHIQEIIDYAQTCVGFDKPMLLKDRRIIFQVGDGIQGVADKGPYDAINIGAVTDDVPPALLQQLKPGGRIVVPLKKFKEGGYMSIMTVVDKLTNGSVVKASVDKFSPDPITDFLVHKDLQLGPLLRQIKPKTTW